MKKDIKVTTFADAEKAVALANVAYAKRDKIAYTKVAKAIEDMNTAVSGYNATIAHDVWDKVGVSIEGFAKTARHDKLTVKLDKDDNCFKTDYIKSIYSLASFKAWHGLDNVKVLPDGWAETVKTSLAELAAMVAKTAEDVNTDEEIARINAKYKTDVRGSKRDAKKSLQALVDIIMPGYTVTGADLTKVMLGCFKVSTTTWKISLPTEDTLIKVFSGLLAAMVNGQDVNDIFDWPAKTEDKAK